MFSDIVAWLLALGVCKLPRGVEGFICGERTPRGEKSSLEPTKSLPAINDDATFSGLPPEDQTRAPRGNRPNVWSSLPPLALLSAEDDGGVMESESLSAKLADTILERGLGLMGGGGMEALLVESVAIVDFSISELKLSIPMPDMVSW